jgi:hypothetical protein
MVEAERLHTFPFTVLDAMVEAERLHTFPFTALDAMVIVDPVSAVG